MSSIQTIFNNKNICSINLFDERGELVESMYNRKREMLLTWYKERGEMR